MEKKIESKMIELFNKKILTKLDVITFTFINYYPNKSVSELSRLSACSQSRMYESIERLEVNNLINSSQTTPKRYNLNG